MYSVSNYSLVVNPIRRIRKSDGVVGEFWLCESVFNGCECVVYFSKNILVDYPCGFFLQPWECLPTRIDGLLFAVRPFSFLYKYVGSSSSDSDSYGSKSFVDGYVIECNEMFAKVLLSNNDVVEVYVNDDILDAVRKHGLPCYIGNIELHKDDSEK